MRKAVVSVGERSNGFERFHGRLTVLADERSGSFFLLAKARERLETGSVGRLSGRAA